MAVQPTSPIAMARMFQRIKQAELAKTLDCAIATISGVERGVTPLSPKLMNKWLDALKLTGDDRKAVALSVMPEAYRVEVGE